MLAIKTAAHKKRKEKNESSRKMHLHLKEGNAQIKTASVSRWATPAQLSQDGALLGGKESPVSCFFPSVSHWLKRRVLCVQMEMRSQDQALIRQLMELHSGIQELKQELSEEEQEDTDEEEEEGSYWDSESEQGSGSVYSSSGEVGWSISCPKAPQPRYMRALPRRAFYRRSSVPWW